MKLINNPNDEQLSALLSYIAYWHHPSWDIPKPGEYIAWPSDWPDLDDAALREDRKDTWAFAKRVSKEVKQWPAWMKTQGQELYLSYVPRQQRRMRKGG